MSKKLRKIKPTKINAEEFRHKCNEFLISRGIDPTETQIHSNKKKSKSKNEPDNSVL